MIEQLNEFQISNDALNDEIELRRRINEEGYLFFRKLQNPDRLLKLRQDMLNVINNGGWLDSGSNLIDGIADISQQCTEGDIEYPSVYHEVYKLESFHRAAHWQEVLNIMEKVINGPVLPHPQKVARLWFPQFTQHTTPAHQDFVHFQGSYDTYTCWTPVGDCPRDLGGLAILPGTHKAEIVYDHHFSLGAVGLNVDEQKVKGQWLTADYEIGDCLIFHSLTLHKALPNITENKLRISLDNRYQSIENPIAEHQLNPHMAATYPFTWEEVYANWEEKDLQYYWLDKVQKIIPTDKSYIARGFTEALLLAKKGDSRAILKLKRITKLFPNSDEAKLAKEALSD